MKRLGLVGLAAGMWAAVGCGAVRDDWPEDGAPERLDIAVGTSAINVDLVLAFVNGAEATVEVLDGEVGLDARAAVGIVAHVRGRDGRYGTSDDDRFDTLQDLDRIAYVGQKAFDLLDAYVRGSAAPAELVVEGLTLTRAEAAAIVAVANTTTLALLDGPIGLDTRAATAIVAARPIADIEALAAVSYVGATALAHLRDYAAKQAQPSTPPPTPTPSDAAWEAAARAQIGDMVSNDYPRLSDFDVPLASMPRAAQERASADAAVLELATTHRIPVQGRDVWVVVDTDGSGEGGTVVIDLVDASGRWFAHGMAHAVWDGAGGFFWGLESDDPTLCACGLDGDPARAACRWLDGTVTASTELACESAAPTPPPATCTAFGGTYDGVTFTRDEECHALDFVNHARYSQLASLPIGARHVAYDCRVENSLVLCDGYRAGRWTTLFQLAADPRVGRAGLAAIKTASGAWTDDGLHYDTIANTWANRDALREVRLTFERVYLARRYSNGCYELRDAPGGANWLTACPSSGAPEPTCADECFTSLVGQLLRLRGTLRPTTTGYRLNLDDARPEPSNPNL